MHYPTEVTEETYKPLKALAGDLGLKIVQFCPHFWVDPRWKFGQFSNPDPKLRQQAMDLARRTTEIAAYMEAEIMVYWPAQDGYDYPFQVDHGQRAGQPGGMPDGMGGLQPTTEDRVGIQGL